MRNGDFITSKCCRCSVNEQFIIANIAVYKIHANIIYYKHLDIITRLVYENKNNPLRHKTRCSRLQAIYDLIPKNAIKYL